MNLFLIAVVSFLLGSIPTGYLVARAHGVDIRQHGSGNIGATNVFRTLGKPLGIFVFIADVLKGYVAVRLAMRFGSADLAWSGVVGAVAVIAGHNYTPWLRFKGGKGIATSGGVLVALAPWAALGGILVWIILFYTTRYVSVASLGATISLPLVVGSLWLLGYEDSNVLFGFVLLISALAIWRHRSNIQRLRNGTESRFSKEKKL